MLNQQDVQELLAGLKARQQRTQESMQINAEKPWVLKGLNTQRITQQNLIQLIKQQVSRVDK